MKKITIIILTIIFTFTIAGCNNSSEPIKVIVPNGIPAIAQSQMEINESQDNFQIERVTGPAPLIAAFTSESHQIIIAPLNVGANLYNKEAPYKLAAILTWSNLQLISKTEIDIDNFNGETIYAFGQGAIPEMVIDYIFNSIISENPPIIDYTSSSTQESFLSFMQNEDSLAIVSEPITSVAKSQIPNLFVYDLLPLWQTSSGMSDFPQAGVFVHNDLSEDTINNYLTELNNSTLEVLSQPEEASIDCESLEYPFEKDIIETSIPNSHIEFALACENKDLINDFLEMIFNFNKELIGSKIPDNDFYW